MRSTQRPMCAAVKVGTSLSRLINTPTVTVEPFRCRALSEMARRAPEKLAWLTITSRIRRRGEAGGGISTSGEPTDGTDVNLATAPVVGGLQKLRPFGPAP